MNWLRPILAVALIVTPAAAYAQESGSVAFRIKARVAESCAVDASVAPIANTATGMIGTIAEACNSGDGYTLIASYRELESSEAATLVFEGRTIALGRFGEATLATRRGPTRRMRTLNVSSSELESPLTLTIAIATI